MIFFYKNYDKCLRATIVSILGSACYLGAIGCLIGAFSDGESEEMGIIILCAIVFALLGFGLGKWADHIANKKYKKLAAKQSKSEPSLPTNTIPKTIISSPIQEVKAEEKQLPKEEVQPSVEEKKEVFAPEKKPIEKSKTVLVSDAEEDDSAWKCTKCGNTNTSKFCKECGTPRPPKQKYCKNCGSKLDGNEKFCGDCGTKVT